MTTTDKFWSEKLTWAFGSGELKTWDYLTGLLKSVVLFYDKTVDFALTLDFIQYNYFENMYNNSLKPEP